MKDISNRKNSSKTIIALMLAVMMLGTTGCQAVTPGPCTTRNITYVGAQDAAEGQETATEEETSAAETEEAETETTAEEGTPMISTAGINVRSGPSTEADVVGGLEEGDEVMVVGTEGNWSIVLFEGQRCYASSKYLKAKE